MSFPAQKVEVVVEHFRAHVTPLLGGRAKAMVVVGSRVEAVRWKVAIDKYIRDKRYAIGTLVAFSGDVTDPETSVEALSEHSKLLNPVLKGRDIRDASPDLAKGLVDAIMESYDAHTAMSQQALGSKSLQEALLHLLLDYTGLYESLRARATS